jgi:hypothetical protein
MNEPQNRPIVLEHAAGKYWWMFWAEKDDAMAQCEISRLKLKPLEIILTNSDDHRSPIHGKVYRAKLTTKQADKVKSSLVTMSLLLD